MNTVLCYDLGRSPFQETWDLQKAIQLELINHKLAIRNGKPAGTSPKDVLLFVEHPHVYTLGKSGSEEHLLKSNDELSNLDATYVKIDRGGDITYHGPGQIVGYPILDLDRYFTDIHKYLRFLEEIIIRTCSDYGIVAGRIDKLTGVWVGDSKICAFGIKCTRWVTLHGFALNVNAHLEYFGNIIPCGISDKKVCSISSLLSRKIDENEVKDRIRYHFEQLFNVKIQNQMDSRLQLFGKYGIATGKVRF
jgi:lipoyl(octanoyl) transferase